MHCLDGAQIAMGAIQPQGRQCVLCQLCENSRIWANNDDDDDGDDNDRKKNTNKNQNKNKQNKKKKTRTTDV